MQETIYICKLQHTLNTMLNTTFIQYLPDGDTFIRHIQCCVLEVLYIINFELIVIHVFILQN